MMSLVDCPECGHSISDRAKSCPSCGFPIGSRTRINRVAEGAKDAVKSVNETLSNPVKKVDLEALLSDVEKLPPNFHPGHTLNGIGTSTDGYIGIPGVSNLGIVRKHFCFLFIPIIPMGLYIVKDWNGTGGVFVGRISSERASKYVNIKKQGLLMLGGGLLKLSIVVGLIILVLYLAGKFK